MSEEKFNLGDLASKVQVQPSQKKTTVSLGAELNDLLFKMKAQIEADTGGRMTVSLLARIFLREAITARGIEVPDEVSDLDA